MKKYGINAINQRRNPNSNPRIALEKKTLCKENKV